jgi:hypothetical protein
MSFFSNLWGGAAPPTQPETKKEQQTPQKNHNPQNTQNPSKLPTTSTSETQKPLESKPELTPTPSGSSQTTKPMFKGLNFKTKAQAQTTHPPTPTQSQHNTQQIQSNQPIQRAPVKAGGVMALMKKNETQTKPQQIEEKVEKVENTLKSPQTADMNSFLDSDDERQQGRMRNDDNGDDNEEESSGFDFMTEDDSTDTKTTPKYTNESIHIQQQVPAKSGFSALIGKKNAQNGGITATSRSALMTKTGPQLQQQANVMGSFEQNDDQKIDKNEKIENNIGEEEDLFSSSSPLVYKSRSISEYDKMLYTTTQEITLHLPSYRELVKKLSNYQIEYQITLKKLSQNTLDLQEKQKKLQICLENDEFDSAAV